MNEVRIKLNQLSKEYGENHAVKPFDLEVKKGELFCFLGPNGSGKTTTIKMMTGLLEPTNGTVHISGVNMWKEALEAKKQIAYVPDQPKLYPKLTGSEFLQFTASVFRLKEKEFEERAERYVRMFQLEHRLDELIETYSHGMKQKLSLCAALLHEPKVLFLDEPTVGLDPKGARTMKNLLQELCRGGMTVFMSTHILEIAEQMCDRVAIIKNGDLLTVGTVDELRQEKGSENSSLEDLFLELTGDQETQSYVQEMEDDQSKGIRE
ncbi:ABC transporter ATP-binding protein [Alkalihalophilus pseudofirmus]|uniref:ABC transporter ATP-binding protein n=1 Tax=Alkalihalophilus pseudofirmus TaxID=79885 RepID=UPI00259B7BC6|nr:ABC transporter ATP-binding protein [Alkalihalophilus pseudofirmus]WEG16354.1 ABC transporter ATP-binding protein [Alkalihalophilus pseudofirmus]